MVDEAYPNPNDDGGGKPGAVLPNSLSDLSANLLPTAIMDMLIALPARRFVGTSFTPIHSQHAASSARLTIPSP